MTKAVTTKTQGPEDQVSLMQVLAPPRQPRISPDLLTPRTITEVMKALVAAWNEEIEINYRDRERMTGIPRYSAIHRVDIDYEPCGRQLRRLIICCENRIDVSLCIPERLNFYNCRGYMS